MPGNQPYLTERGQRISYLTDLAACLQTKSDVVAYCFDDQGGLIALERR